MFLQDLRAPRGRQARGFGRWGADRKGIKRLALLYQIQQIKLSEVETTTTEWDDLVKELPSGDLLTLKDIKAALAGDPFHYFPGMDAKRQRLEGIQREEWTYYFTVFHNSEEFGLPHGGGWMDELPWVVHFLTQMRHTKRLIELDASAEAARSTTTGGELSPAIFQR